MRMKLTSNPSHFLHWHLLSPTPRHHPHRPTPEQSPALQLKALGTAGATDNIGRAIAFHRVASGLGLVLFDRSLDKLAAGWGLAIGLEALKGSIRGHDGGVLVNNADVSYPYA
jgi:hypothetical protein